MHNAVIIELYLQARLKAGVGKVDKQGLMSGGLTFRAFFFTSLFAVGQDGAIAAGCENGKEQLLSFTEATESEASAKKEFSKECEASEREKTETCGGEPHSRCFCARFNLYKQSRKYLNSLNARCLSTLATQADVSSPSGITSDSAQRHAGSLNNTAALGHGASRIEAIEIAGRSNTAFDEVAAFRARLKKARKDLGAVPTNALLDPAYPAR